MVGLWLIFHGIARLLLERCHAWTMRDSIYLALLTHLAFPDQACQRLPCSQQANVLPILVLT